MIKRLALVATAAIFALAFATTAVAKRPTSTHRRPVTRGHAATGTLDQVVQWNQVLQTVLVAPGAQPGAIHPTRTMAITQVAVFDALLPTQAATVMDRLVGTDRFPFSLSNASVGTTRTFGGFMQAAAEASASRTVTPTGQR